MEGERGRLGGEERKNYDNQKGRRERRRREGGAGEFFPAAHKFLVHLF